jgi:hypothetical protein
MATAVIPGSTRPVLVPARSVRSSPSLSDLSISQGREQASVDDLTIRRITKTHHGRTLLTLGHAAEHLANSRRYSSQEFDRESNFEAIHLLMKLSRSVFEDYARCQTMNRRFEWWVTERAVRLFE